MLGDARSALTWDDASRLMQGSGCLKTCSFQKEEEKVLEKNNNKNEAMQAVNQASMRTAHAEEVSVKTASEFNDLRALITQHIRSSRCSTAFVADAIRAGQAISC